ncbi:MAG: LamG domain-containing protein [Candidatus Nanohaloarchaea archaeon]|nr:LamG domain-containing protein [Candidatus Nanohaloarchaea archaeon]
MRPRTGVSPLVSAAIYVGIVLAGVVIVLNVGLPALDRMQDTAAIQSAIDQFNELDGVIRTVASEGRFSARTYRLSIDRGHVTFENSSNTLVYEIETTSDIISTHAVVQQGEVRLSANADVTVNSSTVNGIDCYRMATDELSACIRSIPRGFNASAHRQMVGFWSFDEGSGQYANDSSRYTNNGTRGASTASESADPSWTGNGIHGSALDFDGSDDNVTVPDTASLDIDGNITVAAWVNASGNVTTAVPGVGPVVEKGGAYGVWANTTTAVFELDGQNVTAAVDGGWTHILGTYNGTHQDLYVDGERQTSAPASITISSNTQALGIGDGYNGTVDDVRVWNRSLTGAEVEWLYLKEGDEQYVNMSEMVVRMKDRETGEVLNGTVSTYINGSTTSAAGRGSTHAVATGDTLPRGRVAVNMTGSGEGAYNVTYELLSGADFLTVRTETDTINSSTVAMRYVVDDRATDAVVIDDAVRGPGVYTGSGLDFGYAVSEGTQMLSGVVPGGAVQQVGYDNETAAGTYRVNVTRDGDAIFLIPFTAARAGDVEEREAEISNGVIGEGDFFSYPEPTFSGELTRQKTVRAALQYDAFTVEGFSGRLSGGQVLLVENQGVEGGKTVVRVAPK